MTESAANLAFLDLYVRRFFRNPSGVIGDDWLVGFTQLGTNYTFRFVAPPLPTLNVHPELTITMPGMSAVNGYAAQFTNGDTHNFCRNRRLTKNIRGTCCEQGRPLMPRQARLVVPNAPHHVTQRGNRRQVTFFQDADYLLYLQLDTSKNRICSRGSGVVDRMTAVSGGRCVVFRSPCSRPVTPPSLFVRA